MKLLEPMIGRNVLPTRLAVRREALKTRMTLAEEPLQPGAGLITNFKSWLTAPTEKKSIPVPTGTGGIDYVQVTGQECCEAFFRELRARFKLAERTITSSTRIRVS